MARRRLATARTVLTRSRAHQMPLPCCACRFVAGHSAWLRDPSPPSGVTEEARNKGKGEHRRIKHTLHISDCTSPPWTGTAPAAFALRPRCLHVCFWRFLRQASWQPQKAAAVRRARSGRGKGRGTGRWDGGGCCCYCCCCCQCCFCVARLWSASLVPSLSPSRHRQTRSRADTQSSQGVEARASELLTPLRIRRPSVQISPSTTSAGQLLQPCLPA
jgi:hypothetical protein